jgi:S-adenosylmethionine hydrolase
MDRESRPIVFLSDYGLEDEFVGTCHGVIARIAPHIRVIDLSHAVPPQDIRRGALMLAQAIPYMPEDAVFLAVVDPAVGTNRRAVAVEAGSGRLLVGPDNGILSLAVADLQGVSRAVEITAEDVLLTPTSATFHGRDVFAPAAAHLAIGRPLEALGPEVGPDTLVYLPQPGVVVRPGELRAEIIGTDRFGNLQLSARPEHLEAAGLGGQPELAVHWPGGPPTPILMVRTFGEVPEGDLALFADSSGWLAVAINGGSAAEALAAAPGDSVIVGRA